MKKILIVDDEAPIRHTLRDILEFEKYHVEEATDGLECVTKVQQGKFDVVILDIKMPKMDGMEALERIQILEPELPVIMVSGHGTIDIAVEAVKKGAFDFIAKPPDLNRLLITIRNAMERKALVVTNKELKRKPKGMSKAVKIVGESAPILEVKRQIEHLAPTPADVLILGQNGTGKELVARYLHEKSNRNSGPLVEVNCAAIPDTLIDSQFFGHKKGAFTDAKENRVGFFEAANGGTLFLDEIGDMSPSAQSKILRAIEYRQITPVGSNKVIKIDIRVVAATNKNLPKEIEKGNFRKDLFYRLNRTMVHIPSLNKRRDDIPLLVGHFSKKLAKEYNKPMLSFTHEAEEALLQYNWVGNIRELANVVERLYIYCNGTVTFEDIDKYVLSNSMDAIFEAM